MTSQSFWLGKTKFMLIKLQQGISGGSAATYEPMELH